MTSTDELRRLVEAERGARAPEPVVARGWSAVNRALAKGVTPMAVATGPLAIWSTAAKALAVSFVGGAVVTTASLTIVGGVSEPVVVASSSAVAVVVPRAPVRAEGAAKAPSVPSAVPPEPSDSAGGRPPSSPSGASTLEAEVDLIRRAKAALNTGQPLLARVWLDQHQAQFPRGVLAAEREGLRVVVLCQGGQLEEGRRRARRLLARGTVLAEPIAGACQLDRHDLVE